jgi:hypothetical protein
VGHRGSRSAQPDPTKLVATLVLFAIGAVWRAIALALPAIALIAVAIVPVAAAIASEARAMVSIAGVIESIASAGRLAAIAIDVGAAAIDLIACASGVLAWASGAIAREIGAIAIAIAVAARGDRRSGADNAVIRGRGGGWVRKGCGGGMGEPSNATQSGRTLIGWVGRPMLGVSRSGTSAGVGRGGR